MRSCAAPRRSADGAPSRNWGYGRLDVSLALRTRLLPDSHEPNDWVAAALAQRPLRPGAVVVASLGWAGDTVDAYTVDVPAGTTARAVLRQGGQGVAMQVLLDPRDRATPQLTAVARTRAGAGLAGRRCRRAARSLVVAAQPGRRAPTRSRSREPGLRAEAASRRRPRPRGPRADHQVMAPPISTTLPIR